METQKTLKSKITRKVKELESLENVEGRKIKAQKIMQELTELDLKLNLLKQNEGKECELDEIENLTFIDNLNNTIWKDLDELKEYLLNNGYAYDFYDTTFTILNIEYFDDKLKCLQEQEEYERRSGNYTYKRTMQGILVNL